MKNEILIDEKSKKLLSELQRTISELQDRMQLICMTLINANGEEGRFDLAQDFSKLVRPESFGDQEVK